LRTTALRELSYLAGTARIGKTSSRTGRLFSAGTKEFRQHLATFHTQHAAMRLHPMV